jgi:hypothetical protein
VVLLPEARRNLLWMTRLQSSDYHGPLWPLTAEDCAIEVQTDASGRGYGVWFQGRLFSGESDDTDIQIHINVKEISALWIFFTEILPASTRMTSILWRIDNTAALAHIRKGASGEGLS